MSDRPDLIAAKKRLVAKPPQARGIGPQPQPSMGDRVLHTLTGVANPRTQPFAEPPGPVDLLMAAAPLAGGFKYLKGLADALPKTTPARVAGKFKALNASQEMSPELKAEALMYAQHGDAGPFMPRSSGPDVGRTAINQFVVPKLLEAATAGRFGRREFLKKAAGARGRYRDVKALQRLPQFLQDSAMAGEIGLGMDDPIWQGMLKQDSRLINMFGGMTKINHPGETVPQVIPKLLGADSPDALGGFEKWEALDNLADANLDIVQQTLRNPSIIGQRIRRILGLQAEREAAPLEAAGTLLGVNK